MDLSAFLAAFASFCAVLGVPCGILFREVIKSKDAHAANQAADCAREIANLKEAHARELAARDREIADRDRRLEVASVTEARLIEMALRTTVTGERAASAAEVALRGKAS